MSQSTEYELGSETQTLASIVLSDENYDRLIKILEEAPPIAEPLLKGRDYLKFHGVVI